MIITIEKPISGALYLKNEIRALYHDNEWFELPSSKYKDKMFDDFKEYGNKVLEEFKARAKAAGYTMPKSYEGVRLSFKSEEVQGWILLRLSLHDPVMPLNIEGGRKGDLAKLVEIARKLTDGFDRLDRSCLK